MLLEHMYKKFEINIKGGCQSGRKVVTHNSKSDLPLNTSWYIFFSRLLLAIFGNCKTVFGIYYFFPVYIFIYILVVEMQRKTS